MRPLPEEVRIAITASAAVRRNDHVIDVASPGLVLGQACAAGDSACLPNALDLLQSEPDFSLQKKSPVAPYTPSRGWGCAFINALPRGVGASTPRDTAHKGMTR